MGVVALGRYGQTVDTSLQPCWFMGWGLVGESRTGRRVQIHLAMHAPTDTPERRGLTRLWIGSMESVIGNEVALWFASHRVRPFTPIDLRG